jgi:hypothetical protein
LPLDFSKQASREDGSDRTVIIPSYTNSTRSGSFFDPWPMRGI